MTADRIEQAYRFLKDKTEPPEIAMILGSGLNAYGDSISKARRVFAYADIPAFPVSTAPGHKSNLIFGEKFGKRVAVLQGRFHLYEGYTADETVIPLRTVIKLGAKRLFVTNASGGISGELSPGDLAVITDHINFTGRNPLVGANLDEFGPRFPDLSSAYSTEETIKLFKCAEKAGVSLKRGVYAMMLGPSYETPAEIRALKRLGADMVGMSTVPEVIAAAHAGVKCVAVSCVTNMAAGITASPLTEEEVLSVGAMSADKLKALLDEYIRSID